MTNPKPLTRAALTRRVAQQVVWCVVRKSDGLVKGAVSSRKRARELGKLWSTYVDTPFVIIRAELRVKGVRA